MKRYVLAVLVCFAAFVQAQTVTPILEPHQHFVDASGSPCASCKLYTYAAGTTTPQPTYTDSTGIPQNTNPIVLDASGAANIWLGTNAYKFSMNDASGTPLWTVDHVSAAATVASINVLLSGYISSTQLTAQTMAGPLNTPALNGVRLIDPTTTDPCASITTAIAALPSTGGKVDATGVPGGTCAATLTVSKASVTIVWGAGTFVFNGNPGINITAADVTMEGPGSSHPYNTLKNGVLESGGAYPLIVARPDNFHLRNLNLFGNSVGTFGVLNAGGAGAQYEGITGTYFTYFGISSPGGTGLLRNVWLNHNGENALIGSDTRVEGQSEFELSSLGNGLHVIAGGDIITCQSCDHNAFYNIYLDARTWGDWILTTAFTPYHALNPATNNAGGYLFMNIGAGTTGGSRPTFPQTPGSTVVDGSVTWVNLGIVSSTQNNSVNFTHLVGNFVNDGGISGAGGNVRVEAQGGNSAFIYIDSLHTSQVDFPLGTQYKPVKALELIGLQNVEVSGFQWYGTNSAGDGADTGGLYISGSSDIEVSNFTSLYGAVTPLFITGSFRVHVKGVTIQNVGSVGTAVASTYCAHIDTSNQTIIDDFHCEGGTAWARGIYDAGSGTTISNYKNYTTNSLTDDSLGGTISLQSDLSGAVNYLINGAYNSSTPIDTSAFNMLYGAYIGSRSGQIGNWVNRRYIWSITDAQDETCFGVPTSGSTGADASVCRLKLGNNGRLGWNGGTQLDSSDAVVTSASTPIVNTLACIKVVGPPVVLGYCSSNPAGGPPQTCTCN